MLMIVVESHGSSPGKPGAKMAVTSHGECFGTIGGGALESALLKEARSALQEDGLEPRLRRLQHHPTRDGEASGMICGGEQTVLLYNCRQDQSALFRSLADNPQGVLTLSPAGIAFDDAQTLPESCRFTRQGDNDWWYKESVGWSKQAYIIGGGHVGLALSRILATLDFDITVIDERENLDTLTRNVYARQKLTLPYREIGTAIPEGSLIYVLIMTHSHYADQKIAECLAGKKVDYMGVLGSRKKIAQLKAKLAETLSADELQRIRGPIGLPIHSHTPEEIAVSIAAELIQISNSANSEPE
ncbi:XdhC family protein [Methylotuvimicrobium alcaliphilum]|uniref:Xanthine dehydrogenase accessory factor n=1 Tax=Methylotuvimicrobium alcaliphilum (strain DSM 19304 / NCIMB 14124 / VKM B-2133 / 20Z) TaxID=1091494 RepID=G4SXS7_META2|nr:XdhC family protein [Methylotuvimicrobium alcaliphilum]CCE23121.1 putative xanthine dehydrogenase accessory factor [Methylotuvimicrobium alcaliphilum 20Z]